MKNQSLTDQVPQNYVCILSQQKNEMILTYNYFVIIIVLVIVTWKIIVVPTTFFSAGGRNSSQSMIFSIENTRILDWFCCAHYIFVNFSFPTFLFSHDSNTQLILNYFQSPVSSCIYFPIWHYLLMKMNCINQ